jgi:hypothetical protein
VNALNALIFTIAGSVMGLLPAVFPSWFPPTGADESSTRALWLDVMGMVQAGMGLSFLIRVQLIPFASRIFSTARSGETGSLALPQARGIPGR